MYLHAIGRSVSELLKQGGLSLPSRTQPSTLTVKSNSPAGQALAPFVRRHVESCTVSHRSGNVSEKADVHSLPRHFLTEQQHWILTFIIIIIFIKKEKSCIYFLIFSKKQYYYFENQLCKCFWHWAEIICWFSPLVLRFLLLCFQCPQG